MPSVVPAVIPNMPSLHYTEVPTSSFVWNRQSRIAHKIGLEIGSPPCLLYYIQALVEWVLTSSIPTNALDETRPGEPSYPRCNVFNHCHDHGVDARND